MAIRLDHEHLPGIVIEDTYWLIGNLEIGLFDETMRVYMRCYLNEDARHQRLQQGALDELTVARESGATEGQLEVIRTRWSRYNRPLNRHDDKAFILDVAHSDYVKRIKPILAQLQEAVYALAKEQPEPFGLANHFAEGKDV